MCVFMCKYTLLSLWDSADIGLAVTSRVCCSSLLLRGNTPETRGTAYVVYEDIFDAKNACDHLSGFNVCNRYLVVLYYNANRVRMSINVCRHHEVKVQFKKNQESVQNSKHSFSLFSLCRLSRKWTQRRKRNSWSFWKRNTASTQTLQSNIQEIPPPPFDPSYPESTNTKIRCSFYTGIDFLIHLLKILFIF